MKLRLRCLLPAVLLGLAGLSLAVPCVAQEPAPQTEDGEKSEAPIREQNVYIPYEKLRQVFERHGRGVFLPYEKFQELWRAAREATRPTAEQKPPVGALITEIENEATVSKDVIQVKALLKIELLAEGWHEIPLRLADAAITSATLGGRPARILGAANQDYKLLVEKKGEQPEQIELVLEYAKAITKAPGQNSVSLQAPQAPVSRWRVRIPQSGVKVNVHPLIAATEVPAEEGGSEAESPDETVVLAFVGAAPMVRIDWTPKAEGATGLTALASAEAQQQVWINEGVIRTRTMLAYTINRADLARLVIEVPADQKVVNVFDANVRQWSVESVDAKQQITAELFEPAKGSQQVTVELEKFVGDEPASSVQVPVVRAVDVGRQQGLVVVQVAGGLRAEATKTSGLLQVDAGELPKTLARGGWGFSYRYSTVPFELELGIEKVQPRIVADALMEAYLDPQRLSVDLLVVYTIERAGVFRLELDVPSGYEVRRVGGRSAAGAKPVQVDSHHLEGDDKTRLVVNLSRKAMGRVALAVELQQELPQGDALAQPGQATRLKLAIPQVAGEALQRSTGRVVVYAPESLRVNPGETAGLRSISFGDAFEALPSRRDHQPADVRPVLAMAYTQEPTSLELIAQRRKPQVTVKQLLVTRIENGVVKYEATFFYEVLYSGVKQLRIDVPSDVAESLRNKTAQMQEKVLDPAPEDLAEGDVAWSFTGESELLGEGKIELVWEQKIEKLTAGQPTAITVPRLKPMGVDRAWGQIVLIKAETIDVQAEDAAAALRPIDPQHELMAPVAGAARAFEFHDDWQLTIAATQYDLEEIKDTSIERAVVRMVVTPADEVSIQALYRIRSARQRLVVKLPAKKVDFDTEPLRINGRGVSLEKGQDEYFIPLMDSDSDKPFLLELRYTVAGSGRVLDLPVFPSKPAVQRVHLCVYLPEERTLLGTAGPWTQEFRWQLDPSFGPVPRPRDNVADLISEVCTGIDALTGNPAETFETDGRLYVFSTLRPEPPPDGSLRLVTCDGVWLRGLIFFVVVLSGALLLPATAGPRALAVGALLVALVLCGVFLPTFAMQILNRVLCWAIFLVLVTWSVWYLAKTRPAEIARRRAAEAPLPPPVEDAEPAEDQPHPGSDQGGQADA